MRVSWIAMGPVKAFRLYQRTLGDWELVRQGPSAPGRLIEVIDRLPPPGTQNITPEYALYLNDVQVWGKKNTSADGGHEGQCVHHANCVHHQQPGKV